MRLRSNYANAIIKRKTKEVFTMNLKKRIAIFLSLLLVSILHSLEVYYQNAYHSDIKLMKPKVIVLVAEFEKILLLFFML